MDVPLFTLDLSDVYFRLCLLAAIGFSVGIVIYLALIKAKSWRFMPHTYLDFAETPISKRCAAIVSMVVALPFLVLSYSDTWQHFYKVSQDEENLYLHYPYPKSAVKLNKNSKLEVNAQFEIRRGYRIKLVDKRRFVYSSQIMDRQNALENQEKIEDVLKPYHRLNNRKI